MKLDKSPLKIGIVAPHNWPIPYKNHGGEICILDLANALSKLGHVVYLFAPDGTIFDNLYPIECGYGQYPPSSENCEIAAYEKYKNILYEMDVIHDFSITKRITQIMNYNGYGNIIQTLLGGAWLDYNNPINLVVWSNAHKDRVLRGATDYENTLTPYLAGSNGFRVNECQVVNGGIDTGFYCPDKYQKSDYFLWMNRWHPAKGYSQILQIAKLCPDHKFVIAGTHPNDEVSSYQQQNALQLEKDIKHIDNIELFYLASDPNHHLNKRELYRNAKALLYTVQFHEPFGLSQVEALACGTPVIATNYGSCPEIINDGKTGFICHNDPLDFASKLDQINMIDVIQCRKNSVSRFDKFVMAKNYLKQYQRIMEK